MDLSSRYRAALAGKGFAPDAAQERALAVLQATARGVLARRPRGGLRGWLGSLRRPPRSAVQGATRGAYLWGGVGRGKTFLMDLFCDALPAGIPRRQHFHRLMQDVHRRLGALRHEQAPLDIVAAEMAADMRVLCLDEFFVADIADAMILANLLDGLLRQGVTLVATSNSVPEDLYRDGLQRQRFLPAIRLIRDHMEVVHVDGRTDYRLRVLEAASVYHVPADQAAEARLEQWFGALAPDHGARDVAIEINGRNIHARRVADGVAWFAFAELCEGPRSQEDYIELARDFGTVLLSDVPVLDETRENEARRFVALVDEFYDRRVKLILSAGAGPDGIYRGTRLERDFVRTASRLVEMQSRDYLSAAHLP